jgi:NADH-quinone oxidoreductase subunit H
VIDSIAQTLNAHAELIIALVKIALLLFIVLTVNAYLTWFERKVVAHIQSRWGPHRVGPHGLLQPAADGLKFLLKEDPTPAGVDKFTYYLAPLMALALALTSIAILPFGPDPIRLFGHEIKLGIVDLNIGILAGGCAARRKWLATNLLSRCLLWACC